jgi:hypothetical protein
MARTQEQGDWAVGQWVAQVGPCLHVCEVAALLRVDEASVLADDSLLRVPRTDERAAYPCFQVDGAAQVPHVAEVAGMLARSLTPTGTAASSPPGHRFQDSARPGSPAK